MIFAAFAGIAACGSDAGAPVVGGDGGPKTDGSLSDGNVRIFPPSDGGGDQTGSDDGGDDGGTLSGICADASADPVIDCTGKCGPVKDLCSGKIAECGSCSQDNGVQVCDLNTNTCITPRITCADLGAECGTLKNSCGVYLDCPSGSPKGCPAGQECNDDTHKCQACEQVTCQDLGYECGKAWLGCGPNTADNFTDCGSCAPDAQGHARVCNPQFNVCEPTCTPGSAADICNAAKNTLAAVECGIITDGCGGTVNCDTVAGFGCPSGQLCGVHGIDNRCSTAEIPDECTATGRNCGTTASLCGGSVNCGTCPTNQVCNANGVCGAPCQPKTCTDFQDKECGTFDDTCGGTVTCGNCAGGTCIQATNTCCTANTCPTTYASKCGTKLAAGCGTATINCNCGTGLDCTQDGANTPPPAAGTPGACCKPNAATVYTSKGQCGTKLSDGCGNNTINAVCPGTEECITGSAPGAAPAPGVIGSCCTPDTSGCAANPTKCAAITDTCVTGKTVSCTSNCTGGKVCDTGTCCTPAVCAGNGGAGGECNDTEPGTGPGCSGKTCACNAGLRCICAGHICGGGDGKGACVQPKTCADLPPGTCGTNLDDGAGGTINCNCSTGNVCSSTTAGTAGTCSCANGLGAPYTCANVPMGGDACGTFNDGCGGTVTCNCTTGTCDTVANPNVCCTPTACPTETHTSACGNLSNGCDATQSCGCLKGDVCSGGSCCTPDACPVPAKGSKTACGEVSPKCGGNNCGCTGGVVCNGGTCCSPVACPAPATGSACGAVSNQCGGNNSCGCPSGDACFQGACCAPLKCATFAKPSDALGKACGQMDNKCGGSNNCSCPSGNDQFGDPLLFQCTAGACTCVPDTCRGRSGVHGDGCGGSLNCGS